MHILKKLKKELKSAVEEAGYTEEQWKKLDEKTKKQYLEEHPNSKYAKKDKPSQKDNNSLEEIDETMTTEEAKEYWRDYHTTDPILREYTSYDDWYKDSKENGYIKEETVEKEQYPYTDDKLARYTDYFSKPAPERPTEYFGGEFTIDNWEDEPSEDSYFNSEMSYIGKGIEKAINSNSSGRLDIKYANGEDGDKSFVSIVDKKTGAIYNVVIDEYGIDIMDDDMTTSYLPGEVENGYFEPDDLDSVVQFLKKDITGDSSTYDAGHAEEWMERHPHGYYNSEDDYGTDSEDDYNETMTTEEAKEYWKENHNSDPILVDYDSFEDWYKESKQNGYIKD